jgi:hypothetical protein
MLQANLSRRSALAGLVAAPFAVPLASIASGADTELLALAGQFDPLFNGWVAHMAAEHRNRFEFELAMEAATGIKLEDVPVRLTDDSPEADHRFHESYWATRCKIAPTISREVSDDAARSVCLERSPDAEIDEIEDRLAEIADEILEFNATTREGLAVQVRAMIFRCREAIEPTMDWQGESEDPWQRSFLESVAGFVGTPFPPFRSFVEMLLERPADMHLVAAERSVGHQSFGFLARFAVLCGFAASGARMLTASATKRRTDSERLGKSSCLRRHSSMALIAPSSKPIRSFVGNFSGRGMKYPDMRY